MNILIRSMLDIMLWCAIVDVDVDVDVLTLVMSN